MSNALVIDKNTLNGYGILTINLTNNSLDSDRSQYFDLNTDYFLYHTKITNNNTNIGDCWFISNYKLSNNFECIGGPYYNKDLANEQFINYPETSTLNRIMIQKEDQFVCINENDVTIDENNIKPQPQYSSSNSSTSSSSSSTSLIIFYTPFLKYISSNNSSSSNSSSS